MNTIYFPAFAAFGGSAFGAISTIVTGWVTRRRRVRERHHAHAVSKREKLYRCFIEEASRLYADALTSDKSEIPALVNLYALIGRMRILSNDEVVNAAERAAADHRDLPCAEHIVRRPAGLLGGDGPVARVRRGLPA
ncbi:hypothetical protein ABIA00_002657 [Bradyrhizobium ottawaense]|uniref:hypothetical protein n=1 Tax=Bradyrhizobium ottawaense TaxID=931866 RepID=UPI0038357DAE